jgi:16S rRNA (cytosine1402-N4)-methyltransferase
VRSRHEPVLVSEVLGFLRGGPGLYLDATLGDGGHAEALLDAEPGARLLGTDRDPESLDFAGERLARFGARVTFVQAAFQEIPAAHRDLGGEPLAGALFDLGISSRQLDDPTRGIGFRAGGPLDLRLDPTSGRPASEQIRDADAETLASVLREHGDLREAGRLARAMVRAAAEDRLSTTTELVALVERALGGRPHPRRLAQVFQALRIWVNREAEDLDEALAWLPSAVRAGGVVVMLSYHSGEDRRVKHAVVGERPIVSRRRPPAQAVQESPWEPLHRGVVTPSQEEVARNPRARSARLRAFRRKST